MRILLGITAGIAAYKAAGLVRHLSELGHEVTVLPTENALRFIGLPTLEALSGKSIDIDMYSDVAAVRHVKLGQEAELILIAPATASFMARLAAGLADDLLMNAILASTAPVVLAPAMHSEMWANPATQANLKTLESRGIRVMPPATGRLTGADSGPGRLPEVHDIADFALAAAPKPGPLSKRRVLVTAGGTREAIDPVRFVGNSSSGKQGIAIAQAALEAGAEVTLIAANLDLQVPNAVRVINVVSAAELAEAMAANPSDVIFMAAAVSDFSVANPAATKISRASGLTLELVPTPDLISNYADQYPKSFRVAFSLATEDLEQIGRAKLAAKQAHLVVANSPAALGSDTNSVLLIDEAGVIPHTGSKLQVARQLVAAVGRKLNAVGAPQ